MFIKYSTKIKGSKISNKDFKSFVGFFLSKVAQEFFFSKKWQFELDHSAEPMEDYWL